jgi:hypothetical protein
MRQEVEAEEDGLPAFLQIRSSDVTADPDATTVLRLLTLRQVEKHFLRRMSARLECSPSALVAHRVVYIRDEIDVEIAHDDPSETDDPLAAYRHLLAILYPEPARRS